MLVDIYSPAFKKTKTEERGRISLRPGLNSVVGGGENENGLGKSSFLLAIDFAFGGETYPTPEVNETVGAHYIDWHLRFGNDDYYFRRDTNDHDYVWVCDSNFNVTLESWPIADYRKWLLKAYGLSYSDLTFSVITSIFLKIHPKKNGNHMRIPLKPTPNQPGYDSIVVLEKLFHRYEEIAEKKTKALESQKDVKALAGAEGRKIVKKITPAQNAEHIREKSELEAELKRLHLGQLGNQQRGKKVADEELVKVEASIAILSSQRRKLMAKRNALLPLTQNGPIPDFKAEIERLNHLLNDALDLERIEEIQEFHLGLREILSEQAQEEIASIDQDLRSIDSQIASLSQVRSTFETPVSIPPSYFDRCVEIETRIKELDALIKYYEDHKAMKEEAKKFAEDLGAVELTVLSEIQDQINAELKRLILKMFNDPSRRSPELKIKSDRSYSYSTTRNGSYGCEHRDSILFDIAMCNLVGIPVLAFDNQIIKSTIDDPTIEALFKLLAECSKGKQFFVAFDGLPKYDKPSLVKLIKETTVLQLDDEHGKYLYGWKLDD